MAFKMTADYLMVDKLNGKYDDDMVLNTYTALLSSKNDVLITLFNKEKTYVNWARNRTLKTSWKALP